MMYHKRVIALMSSKGGTGKTTTALNLGVALASLGKDVTVVDANLHNPNIGLHLGAPQVRINLNHVLNNKNHISEAVYRHKSGMKVIPASLSLRDINTPTHSLGSHLKALDTDFILVDCPSGFHENSIHALHAVDEAIVVTHPELPSVTDALKSVNLLRHYKIPVRGAIINKTGSSHDMSSDEIEYFLRAKVLGEVPFDSNIRKSVRYKEPLSFIDPHSPASFAYRQIASHLTGHSNYKRKKFLGLF